MNLSNPVVLLLLGAVLGFISWVTRRALTRLDKRIETLETHVGDLQLQLAAHDGIQDSITLIFDELRKLSGLTNRIAGKLNIS